jgi:hypothetical protein
MLDHGAMAAIGGWPNDGSAPYTELGGECEREVPRGKKRRRSCRQLGTGRDGAVMAAMVELGAGHGVCALRRRRVEWESEQKHSSEGMGAGARSGKARTRPPCGIGDDHAPSAARSDGAMAKLVTVTTCKAGSVATCPSLTPCVASSRQNQVMTLYKRSLSPFTLHFMLKDQGH